ncbi:hypothetical protein ACM9HF_18510 [Colwellia sp. RE-S-Sl-9]
MLKIFTLSFMALFSSLSFAHEGHDHGHWSSNLTHLILAFAVVGIVAVGIQVFRRKNQQRKRGE